jgi:cytochrome c-type biogenesis protein CcmH/NrfG
MCRYKTEKPYSTRIYLLNGQKVESVKYSVYLFATFFAMAFVVQPAWCRPAATPTPASQNKSFDEITLDDLNGPVADPGLDIQDSSNPDTVIAAGKDKIDKLSRQSLIFVARAYKKKSNFVEESRIMELCLAKNPNDYIVQTLVGDAYFHANRLDDAISAYQNAKRLNSRYRPAAEGLLTALEAAGDRLDARGLLLEMIKIFGEEPKFYTILCRLYAADDFLDKTVETCPIAIKKDPNVPENYVYLGNGLNDLEKADQAIAIFNEAAEKFPNSEAVQSGAGFFSAKRKDFPSAYRFFKRAVQLDMKSVRALEGYANACFELQKNQEALGAYLHACQLDRNKAADIRQAIAKLRSRKDVEWQNKFADSLDKCQ